MIQRVASGQESVTKTHDELLGELDDELESDHIIPLTP
jgi:hypothetical protein